MTTNDFPRGGASALNPLEIRQVKAQAAIDFEAGILLEDNPAETLLAKPTKASKKRPRIKEVFEPVAKKSKSEAVEILTFKKLYVGMCLLGAVKEINDLDLVISLPNQLNGFVSISEISDFISKKIESAAEDDDEQEETDIPDLRSLFAIGQLLPCTITALENKDFDKKSKRRVELSLKPQSVNASLAGLAIVQGMILICSVSSEEDHVYMVDLGIKGYSGLLLKKHTKSYFKNTGKDTFQQGQPIYASVLSVNEENKTVSLSMDTTSIEKTAISADSALTFDQLKPGFLISGNISQITDSGLFVNLIDMFTATVDIFHVGRMIRDVNSDFFGKFSEGQKVKGRIIYIDVPRKRIGFSMNSTIVALGGSLNTTEIGAKITMKVIRQDSEKGLVLLSEDESVVGYAHKSRIADTKFVKFTKAYRAGTLHPARVIALNPFDGVASISLQPSILKQAFLTHKDLTAGMMVKECKVMRLTAKGMVVAISDNISGFIPRLHMSDVLLKDPSKLFKIGATIKCQVLFCDPIQQRLLLTHKKTLIASTLPKITSIEDAKPGVIACGVINGFVKDACFVSFYNEIKGYCHISEIRHPSDLHRIGQTIKCRVLSVSNDDDLKLSFKVGKNAESAIANSSIEIGQVVSGTIISKTQSGFVLNLSLQETLKASIAFAHLSDVRDAAHTAKLALNLKEGMVLDDCVVIAVEKRTGEVVLTRKPALVAYAKEKGGLADISKVEPAMVIPGYVKKVLENGCIVGYVGSLQSFARMHSISDRYVADINDFVTIGQTVMSTVTEVDQAQNRISVNLKNSVNFPSNSLVAPSPYETELLVAMLSEREEPEAPASSFIIGGSVKGTIHQLLPYGALVNLDGPLQVCGLITTYQSLGKNLEVGDCIEAKVLDFDNEKKIFSAAVLKTKKYLDVKIEMIKEDYLIVSVPSIENTVCFATVKTFNSRESPFAKYKEGQNIQAVVTRIIKGSSDHELSRVIVVPRTIASGKKDVVGIDSRRKLVSPIDQGITYLDQVTPGLNLKVRVKSIKSNQINVEIAANLYGRIHLCELVDSISDLKNMIDPLKSFKCGDMLDVKVVGFHDVKTNTFLAITKSTAVNSLTVDLTLRSSDIALPDGKLANGSEARHPTFESVQIGDTFDGFIQGVSSDCIWVYIAPLLLARAFLLECSDSSLVLKDLQKNFKPGQAMKCRLISKDDTKKSLDLTLRVDAKLDAGCIIPGRVSNTNNEHGMTIQVAAHTYGRVHLTDINDEFIKKPIEGFKRGDLVDCFVLSRNEGNNQLDLSLRESRVLDKQIPEESFAEIKDLLDIKPDMLVQGYIKHTSESGCFVSLNGKLVGRVKICDLSDIFIKDWKAAFVKGMLVKARVLMVNHESGLIDISMKPSIVDPSSAPSAIVTLESIAVGDKIRGTITKIERYGAFIKFDNSRLSGLCHVKEMSDDPVTDITALYNIGDIVKAIVLEVDKKLRRISLGLKASHFNNEDAMDIDDDIEEVAASDEDEAVDNDEIDSVADIDEDISMPPANDVVDDTKMADVRLLMKNAVPLDIDSEEDCKAEESSDSEAEQSNVINDADSKKKSRSQKAMEKRKLEEATVKKEMMIAAGDAPPESADDYERLLLGSPNSSFLWIRYMAYEFQLAEIGKARAIAERALKTISFREEKEKMNIWVAFMNLENAYGTSESLKKVFDRATCANEPKAVYLQLAQIYRKSNQTELAQDFLQTMLKKFKLSSKVWTSAGLYYLQQGNLDESRSILQRSLKSLPKHKHIKTVCKFAQFEFKHGEAERGRTIFEGMLSNNPKKVDVWNIFLDMEIRNGEVDCIRRLFERVISMKFSSKKIKFFFKKYLMFEKSLGDSGRADHVKEAALAYVEGIN